MIVTELIDLNSSEIKNIIFDWGGVLININYNATIKAFNDLSNTNSKEKYTLLIRKELVNKLESGKITEKQFHEEIKQELGNKLTSHEINAAWCAMLLDIPGERIELLKILSKSFRIFLLSNTNIIHENILIAKINKDLGLEFFSLFEEVYLSHRIGMLKPNSDIFNFVLRKSKLKASETLFIDDSEEHIIGAARTGLNCFHLKPTMDITTVLNSWVK